ncbi:MAG: hypothetical protein RLZZ598_693, partial [Pseudomonadota bacterium]|jgi:hypothetical protein
VHGTTHERPIERFAVEAAHLVPTLSQPSFLAAMLRERVVADDWLVSIDGNRYSVPCRLIGQSVQVVRESDRWVIRHRGQVVAEHPVLTGRSQLAMLPEHGPGAVARNVRQRHSTPRMRTGLEDGREVEVRDLVIYEQLSGVQLEAA